MKYTIMELITDFTPIEKLLLPNGCCFADDARNVINSWDSNDILACPGSGKTTVLIAKLKLIADTLPLKDGRGVCLLSHTNVAVNELKAKLGKSAERLLSYPNFVGTIQTFVDQYITFPFLRQFANTSIQVVSNEDYANHLYNPTSIPLHFVLHFWAKTRVPLSSIYLGDFPRRISLMQQLSNRIHFQVSGISNGISASIQMTSEPPFS